MSTHKKKTKTQYKTVETSHYPIVKDLSYSEVRNWDLKPRSIVLNITNMGDISFLDSAVTIRKNSGQYPIVQTLVDMHNIFQ